MGDLIRVGAVWQQIGQPPPDVRPHVGEDRASHEDQRVAGPSGGAAAAWADGTAERIGRAAQQAGDAFEDVDPRRPTRTGPEHLGHLPGGGKAIPGMPPGRPGDGGAQPFGDVGAGGSGVVTERHGRRRQVRRWALRQRAGERQVEGQAQRVKIRSGVAPTACHDLGRGVLDRSHQAAGPRQRRASGQARRAEIGEPGAPIGVDQDVLWLHIAMEHTAGMGGGERLGDLAPDSGDPVGLERTVRRYATSQVGRIDQLHHDEAPGPPFDEVVHGHDAGVGDAAHRLHFPTHALTGDRRLAGRWRQQLDSHRGIRLPVPGAIDDRIAAAPDLGFDLVAVGEPLAGCQVGQSAGEGRPLHHAPSSARTATAFRRQPSFWS